MPPGMLGRVSSLDFFVSLALMPVSMAIAGPVGETVGLTPTFLLVGVFPTVLAVATLLIARLRTDELAHPLRSNESTSAAGVDLESIDDQRAGVREGPS